MEFHEYNEMLIAEKRKRIREEKAVDKMLAKTEGKRAASWQRVNFGSAEIASTSFEKIVEAMLYTRLSESYC